MPYYPNINMVEKASRKRLMMIGSMPDECLAYIYARTYSSVTLEAQCQI